MEPAESPVSNTELSPRGNTSARAPEISVVVLNYNGMRWIERCLASLREQTLWDRLEVIVADNASADGSDRWAATELARWPNGVFMQHGANLGFCEGNNRAAVRARGRYLFFLNNDTWLEPDCLEVLLRTVEQLGAHAGCPVMLNYQDDTIQSWGAAGFDVFGWMSEARPRSDPADLFVVGGCCYLIRRDLFEQLGGFDAAFFMYAEEFDLSWRVWLSGKRAVQVPAARMHHRTAAEEPDGERGVKLSTSDSRRYYANRNGLWVVWKNAEHVLLLLLVTQVLFLAGEAFLALVWVRRWSFVRRAYLEAFRDCWRGRARVRAARSRIRAVRQRSDWWMLRFFRMRLNRWDSFLAIRKHGLPRVRKV